MITGLLLTWLAALAWAAVVLSAILPPRAQVVSHCLAVAGTIAWVYGS